MGPGRVLVGTRYSPSPAHPHPTHPGYTPPAPTATTQVFTGTARGLNMVVGLKTVAQLTLGVHFSGLRGMTEVYNLLRIVRINNH